MKALFFIGLMVLILGIASFIVPIPSTQRDGISVGDVRNRVRSTRARLGKAILEVIRSYTDSDEEAQEEFRDLMSAFS